MDTLASPIALEEFERETHEMIRPQFVSTFGGVLWKDLGAKEKTYDWLVKGLFAAGETSYIAGPSQSGKSFLATDLALSICRGQPWFNKTVKKGAVVYVAAESGHGVAALRLPAYKEYHALEYSADLPMLTIPRAPNFFFDEDAVKRLIEEIRLFQAYCGEPVQALFLDTFAAISRGADEIKGEHVGKIRGRVQSIVDAIGCAVIIIHHMNAGGEKVRGHGSITADADGVLLVREESERKDANGRKIRKVWPQKLKEGEKGWSMEFTLKKVFLGDDPEGEEITSCVVIQPEPLEFENDETAKAPFAFKSDSGSAYFRCLMDALKRHGEAPDPTLNIPIGQMVVNKKSWLDVCCAQLPGKEGQTDQQRRDAFDKGIQRAANRWPGPGMRIIGFRHPYVWLTGRSVKGFYTGPKGDPVDEESDQKALDDILGGFTGDII